MDGVPAPECVAPDLCASCSNNQLLLSLVRLFGEGYDAQSDALRRRGERRGRYRRVEDEALSLIHI